jgi:formate hydrogenlyase transcriptional activator
LVQAFIERYARTLEKQITSIPKERMKTLQDYPWPGNVRELESVLERAVILCPGPVSQLADKLEISSLPLSSAVRTLEEMERNQIVKILSETRWRIEGKDGAAAILGLHPSTLRARIHKLGILRPGSKSQIKQPGSSQRFPQYMEVPPNIAAQQVLSTFSMLLSY